MSDIKPDGERTKSLAASLSVVGAVLASSCCILPFVFLMLGVSGAWIGNLTVLEPYKNYFAVATLVFLGVGFWHAYFKPRKQCADNSYCAKPRADYVIKTVLWVSTVLVLLALTIDFWAPVIGKYI